MNSAPRVYRRLSFVFLASITSSAFAQTVTVSPTSLSFGNQVQNTASAVQKITLRNGQTTAVTVTSVTTNLSDYTQTNTCPVSPSTLGAGKSCAISVTFTPSLLGARNATLTVKDTGTNSPQTVSLSGTGIASVTASPTSLSFGNQVIGVKSGASKVTITNNQKVTLSITSVTVSPADYSQTNSCPVPPSTLAKGSSCTVSVFFKPTVAGVRNGTLTINDNAAVSPTVSLTGTGVVAATVSPTSLTFASQAMGTTSPAQTVTFTNNQSTALTITSISSNLSDFVVNSSCPSSLAARASCNVSVSFSPKGQGSRSGTLTFTDNASNSPQTASLSGTGAVPNLSLITVTPANPSIAAGTTQQFTATGTYTDGSTQNLNSSVTWSASPQGFATISAAGLATGTAQGTSTVMATSGAITGSTNLTVTPPTLVSIAVTPANASFALGTTLQLKATGTYSDGSTQDLTTSASWTTGNSSVATVNAQGVASGVSVAGTTVTATSGSIAGSTNLTVTPATLVSIAVTPAIPSVPLGTTQQFTATGTFTDGTTQNLTTTVQWISDNPSIATISNSPNTQGLATSIATGPSNITASSTGAGGATITGTTTLTVTSAALVSIALTPQTPSIAKGTTQQFTAIGSYTDGSTQDLTTTAGWSSDTQAVATVSKGLATGAAVGTANISVTSGSTSASTLLSVAAAQLVSIAVNPPTAIVPLGIPQQFTATGTYTDGSTQDLTQSGQWSSSAANVATISMAAGTQGLASTLGTGSTTIGISVGSATAAASLTVAPASLVSITVSPVNASIPLGMSQQFTATGSYTDGSTQDLTAVVTWSSSQATVAVISNATGSNGLAASSGEGTATITATLGSVTNSTTLSVATAALVSISISPPTASIPLGTTQQFTATGTYTDGSTQDLTASVNWSSDTTTVASIGAGGVAVAVGMGGANITASLGSTQGSATLGVGPPVLVSIAISPTTASVAAGRAQQFTATGTYSDGSMQNLTSVLTWSSSATSVATVNASGLATSSTQGVTNVVGSLGSISASATLTVTAPVLDSIAVSPSAAAIPDGTTQQFTATGTYSDGTTQDLTNSASWSSSAPGIATIGSGGLATGAGIGSATVSATSGAITGSAALTVGQPALVSIAITPPSPSLALGTSQPLKATGTYTDGSTQDLTATVTWGTTDSSIASVSNLGIAGSVAVGGTSVSAVSGSITGSTSLTVTPAALVSIAVTPAIPSIPSGTTLQFSATGTFTDGSTQDVTQTVQWSSDTQSVATISSGPTQNGLATSVNTGAATITATSGAVSGSTSLTVTPAILISIAVTPANPSVALGTTQQFTATGTFSDGTTQDLTASVQWNSDSLSTATISASGLATSLAQGTANITASSGSIVGTDVLSVTAAQLVSITINPPAASVPLGLTQQFTATGTYTDGTTQDVTQSAHWSSADGGVATISNAAGTYGLATTLTAGLTTIEVSSGAVNSSASLTVTSAALQSIAINPPSPTIALGTSQQFTAVGTYTDGTTQDVTSIVTWNSSSNTVLVISDNVGSYGLATSSGLGTATITATSGSVSSSTLATVGQAALTSITISPASASIGQGYTLQFTAAGNYSDGTTQDLTQKALWNSSVQGVANINSGGLATAILAGTTIISAASGSVTGSANLTVNPPIPVALSINPPSTAIYINSQQQFTATLLYSDGSSIDVTSSASWASLSSNVAGISNAGLATGLAAGAATIQATWGALVASSILTVQLPTVTITPANTSTALSGTAQFGAIVTGAANQTVTWAVDGAPGGNINIGTISSSGLYTAPPMLGTHTITATAQANSASVGTASITVGTQSPVDSTFFGMHLHLYTSPVPNPMDAVGRIWDSNSAQWPNLNPSNGVWHWGNLDNVLAAYWNGGINDVLYTLWRVPTWASSNPADTTCDYASLGSGFYGACDLPTDLNPDGTGTDLTWRTWVQYVAQHANGINPLTGQAIPNYVATHAHIKYWEPCNECYRSNILDPGYGSGGNVTFAYKGTFAQLVRMMQDARCIIIGHPADPITGMGTTCGGSGYPVIGIDPTAKMVMPSTSPARNNQTSPPYYQVMQNLLYCTCANNSCTQNAYCSGTHGEGASAVDILSVHLYPNTATYTPESIPGQVAQVRRDFQAAELSKPFWSDEGGWGQNSTAAQVGNGDPDLEAAWVARFHIMVWASGLTRVYWYQWDNAAYGTLWSSTGSASCPDQIGLNSYLCTSGIAYQQVHDWLVGSTLTNCSASGSLWTCNITQSNASPAQILWDTLQTCGGGTCGASPHPVSPTFNTYQDLGGVSHSIQAGTVPVGIKPILVMTQ